MKPEKRRFRLDMVITDIEEVDKAKGLFKFRAVPDPKVWEKRTVNGEDGFWHKIDNVFLSWEELKKATPTMTGKPIYVETIGVKNKDEYLRRSKKRIEEKSSS
jgi:hypothetical protein